MMMKKILASAAVVASLFSLSAPASATLTNWYLDTDGAGSNVPVLINDYLDITGTAYVHNTFSGTGFSFNEVGNFTTFSADGSTVLSPVLTAKFIGSGTGTIGGDLTFNPGGSLNVFSSSTNIAEFTLKAGSAVLDAGTVLPNGAISFVFKAVNMLPGYFFDSALNDLSLVANSGILLGFATTNVVLGTATNVNAGLVTDYNSAFGTSFGTVAANSTTDLNISNNGQFRLAVPEPSMLGLFGIALLGVGFLTRRKFKA